MLASCDASAGLPARAFTAMARSPSRLASGRPAGEVEAEETPQDGTAPRGDLALPFLAGAPHGGDQRLQLRLRMRDSVPAFANVVAPAGRYALHRIGTALGVSRPAV